MWDTTTIDTHTYWRMRGWRAVPWKGVWRFSRKDGKLKNSQQCALAVKGHMTIREHPKEDSEDNKGSTNQDVQRTSLLPSFAQHRGDQGEASW